MSLINDALKRAKEAQQPTPPPLDAGTHFRPVEPTPYARHGLGLMIPVGLGLIALFSLFLVWQRAQQTRLLQTSASATGALAVQAGPTPNARTDNEASSPPASVAPPANPAIHRDEPPVQSVARTATEASPSPPPPPVSVSQAATGLPAKSEGDPLASAAPAAQPAAGSVAANPAPAPEPAPKPAPLRLQAIFFTPGHPSAMVGGKTLSIGDRLGDLRVIGITQNSVTLAGAGQTNVLSLSE